MKVVYNIAIHYFKSTSTKHVPYPKAATKYNPKPYQELIKIISD